VYDYISIIHYKPYCGYNSKKRRERFYDCNPNFFLHFYPPESSDAANHRFSCYFALISPYWQGFEGVLPHTHSQRSQVAMMTETLYP
jgi:hypothetical protein